MNNQHLFPEIRNKHAIQSIYGDLIIENGTVIENQNYPIYSVFSTLGINDISILNSIVEEDVIIAYESNLHVNNLILDGVNGSKEINMFSLLSSNFEIQNIEMLNTNVNFGLFLFSTGSLESIEAEDLTSGRVALFRNWDISKINNIKLLNISSEREATIVFINSKIKTISHLEMENIFKLCLRFVNSKVDLIDQITLKDMRRGIRIADGEILMLTNSTMSYSRNDDLRFSGGGINSVNSNITVENSIFTNNKGTEGGAIYVSCIEQIVWVNTIRNNSFINNTATKYGGAIYYNLYRPLLTDNTYLNNSAPYGNNIASYPVKIIYDGSNSTKVHIDDISSGLSYYKELHFRIEGYDGQVVNYLNEQIIKISPTSSQSKIIGTDFAKLVEGRAVFKSITLVHSPGAQNIEFLLTSRALNKNRIKIGLGLSETEYEKYTSKIVVDFRKWNPGEIISGDKRICMEWAFGSYSFDWNSEKWTNCMDNAVCNGTTQVIVDKGYWQKTSNSSTLIECPRKEACLGGYDPENEHPVDCKVGYEGYLWTKCQIIGEDKYQQTSGFQWVKCPNMLLNTFRIIGFTLLVIFS